MKQPAAQLRAIAGLWRRPSWLLAAGFGLFGLACRHLLGEYALGEKFAAASLGCMLCTLTEILGERRKAKQDKEKFTRKNPWGEE